MFVEGDDLDGRRHLAADFRSTSAFVIFATSLFAQGLSVTRTSRAPSIDLELADRETARIIGARQSPSLAQDFIKVLADGGIDVDFSDTSINEILDMGPPPSVPQSRGHSVELGARATPASPTTGN